MLGISRFSRNWQWGACGKHPVARDYFKISHNTPALDALENWVQKGYAALTKKKNPDPVICSWRFWTRGLKKGDLVSGIVKDSCDTIGRPYPLLIIGNGKFDGWEEDWEFLPLFFEKLWDALEYAASRRLEGVNELEKAIKAIKTPETDPKQAQGLKNNLTPNQAEEIDEQQARITAGQLLREKMAIIPIDIRDQHASLARARGLGAYFKTHEAGAPTAVFIGGAGEKQCMAVFRRPLNTGDFIRLWTMPSE